jgi:hypothetical protein
MKKTIILFCLAAMIFVGCKKKFDTLPLDLNKYHIPLKIQAPIDAVVKGTSIGEAVDEVTIQKDKFDVQVLGGILTAVDVKALKAEKVDEMKGDATFNILKETDSGFVYQYTVDTLSYNFFVAKVVGEKQYIFQTGFTALPTKEEAEAMFDAVK